MPEKNKSVPLLLEGKPLRDSILNRLQSITRYVLTTYPQYPSPALAIISIGNNASSQVYIQQKMKYAESVGIQTHVIRHPEDVTTEQIKATIQELNHDSSIHGIILQLPVPKHIDILQLIELIDPKKDSDGAHPLNLGRLLSGGKPYFYSATPLGIIKLLQHYQIPISGKNVVIINRSNIVGKPLAVLLGSKSHYGNATVTLCHTKTSNIEDYTRMADIVISATSYPHSIHENMIKANAVLIDLGQHVSMIDNKRHILGDFSPSAQRIASALTPVPGGVGPMTVAVLLENTIASYLQHFEIDASQVDESF